MALVLTGCAAYVPEPLASSHPAHPEAAATPVGLRSKTLAYAPADTPAPQPPLAEAPAVGPEMKEAEAVQTAVGEGKVVATLPSAGQIVVEHGEIKGFMEAMTMGYRVDSPALMEGLKFGDKIHFTIDVQKKTIIKIEKMQ